MSFAPKQTNWRKMPVEVRESFLTALQQRAVTESSGALTAIDLAKACGVCPDPWQKDLLESEDRQVILLCARQTGKSTISALIALHRAVYTANSLVLVLSPSQRQSQECYRKVRDSYNLLSGVPDLMQESALKLEFANGSR